MWSEGVKTGKIYRIMTDQHSDNSMNHRKVHGGMGGLKGVQTSIDEASLDDHWASISISVSETTNINEIESEMSIVK